MNVLSKKPHPNTKGVTVAAQQYYEYKTKWKKQMASALNYDPGVEEFKEHRSYFAAEESCAMINAPFLEQQLFFCVTCLEFQPCPMFLEALFEHSSGHMFAHLIMIKFLFSLSLSVCISVSLFLSLLPQVTRYLRGNLKVTKHFFSSI